MPAKKYTSEQLRKAQEIVDLEEAIAHERDRRERMQATKSARSAAAKKVRGRKRAERARQLEDAVDQKTGGSIWSVRSPLTIAIMSVIALGIRLGLDERSQTIICADEQPGEQVRFANWMFKTALCDPNVPFVLLLVMVLAVISWFVFREKNEVRAELKRGQAIRKAQD
jgi:hypothetical protein